MPLNTLTGTRIRERRAQAGLRQAELARAAGLSASYLNLIEHNRRKVPPEALERLAAALGVSAQALAGDGEADLGAELREAAAAAAVSVEAARAEEFAGRFPGWAALVVAQHRRVVQLEQAVETLSDRVTQDPQLSDSLHELLSAAASVRSTAAILSDTPDIEPEWRDRFQRNLAEDSARLALGAEAVVGYLDAVAAPETGISTPQEEMETWLAAQDWHPAALEAPQGADLDALVAEAGLASRAARDLVRGWLALAQADARALPMPVLLGALQAGGPDPWHLAQALGADPALVLRRLALMSEGVLPGGAGLVICDGSGTPVFRKPLAGFPLPRFGAACPLWPLYDALALPGQPVRMRVEMAGRQAGRFDAFAWGSIDWPDGFDAPPRRRATMLVRPVPAAAPRGASRPVGTSCRICPRPACSARREPSITGEAG
jgi:transcriptional regulator with XRE-family HTH domain